VFECHEMPSAKFAGGDLEALNQLHKSQGAAKTRANYTKYMTSKWNKFMIATFL